MRRQHAPTESSGAERLKSYFAADPTRLFYIAVLVAVSCLTVMGVTTSSVGISNLTFDGATHDDVLVGTPRDIRSDEWSRNSPQRLGVMRVGGELTTPLSVGSYGEYGQRDGLVAAVVYADNTLARLGQVLPDSQLFAFLWWLPYALIAWAVPYVLRFLGVRPTIAVAAALLVLVSPVLTWWTTMAPLAAAAVLTTSALMAVVVNLVRSDRRGLAVGAACLAGVFAARAALVYPRWTVPLALVVLLPTMVQILGGVDRKRVAAPIVTVVLVGIVGVVAVVIANLEAIEALSATVSPGGLRVPGGGQSIPFLLSAHFAGLYLPASLPLAGTNASEMATGFLLLMIVVASAAVTLRVRVAPEARRFAVWSVAMVGVLLLWVVLPWPDWSVHIPVFNVLKPVRVGQIVGLGATLAFAVLLEAIISSSVPQRRTAFFVGATTAAALVGVGLSLGRNEMPRLSVSAVLATALVVGASVGLCVNRRTLRFGLSSLVAVAVVGAAFSNPFMLGLGDLRGADFDTVAAEMLDAVGSGYIASDTPDGNALALAAGVPTLSGDQVAPSRLWEVLDPNHRHEDEWNRSAILVFKWDSSLESVRIELPQVDGLRIHVSPCSTEMAELGLTALLSAVHIDGPCLEEVDSFGWNNGTVWLYAVAGLGSS